MNRETTIGDFVSLLKREIEERQTIIAALEARLGSEPAIPAAPAPRGKRSAGIGAAAVKILREVGRPMHGLGEILPALEARGFTVAHRAGFATTLMRTGEIDRVAPGTYAAKPHAAAV